ncbi:MAG TPA: carbohydrate-binding protein [Candidatus Krumholzibacteria bacterium]|nr:carbohydrate-binding protein [Candidatus Krumholzibacteria bacterium]
MGLATVPRYMPSEVTVDLLQSQISTVCTGPLWIDDAGLCSQLSDSLDAAETRLANDDFIGARAAVGAAGEIVYANREPFGAIESNAEWLLRLNLAQLLENLPEPSVPTWAAPVTYAVGDEVSYEGLDYRCRQSHTSQSGWEPPNVYALWERINTGGEWAPQVIYQTDDEATYDGTTYRVIQGHQAQVGWEPPNQPALWEEVN